MFKADPTLPGLADRTICWAGRSLAVSSAHSLAASFEVVDDEFGDVSAARGDCVETAAIGRGIAVRSFDLTRLRHRVDAVLSTVAALPRGTKKASEHHQLLMKCRMNLDSWSCIGMSLAENPLTGKEDVWGRDGASLICPDKLQIVLAGFYQFLWREYMRTYVPGHS